MSIIIANKITHVYIYHIVKVSILHHIAYNIHNIYVYL